MKNTCSYLFLLVAIASVLPTSAYGSQTTTVEPDSPSFKKPNDLYHPLPKPVSRQPETINAPGWIVTLLPSGYEALDASITGVVVLEKDSRYYRWIAGGMELLGKGTGAPIVNSSGYIALHDAVAKLWKPQSPSFYFSYPSPTYTYKWQAWDNLGIVPGQIHWTIVQTGVGGGLWVFQFDDKNQIWAGLKTGPDSNFLAKITDSGRAEPLQAAMENPQISRGGHYYYYSPTGIVIDGSYVDNFDLRWFSRNGIAIAWGTYLSDPFRLRLPNGTIEEILIPNVYADSVWVDDQDRLNGSRYDEATYSSKQCLFLKKKDSDGNVISPIEYEAFDYLPLALSDGWQTDHMVAPGTTSPQIGVATKAGESRYFLAMRQLLQVDADRSGTIDDADGTSPDKPFHFWINDDNDDGDTGGTDIPRDNTQAIGLMDGGTSNVDPITTNHSGNVHGARDLVDYFPLFLDIKQLMNTLPPSETVRYKLKQADGAVNFLYTNLTRAKAFEYQRKIITTGFGYALDKPASSAIKYNVPAEGVDLFGGSQMALAFRTAIQNHDGGVILIDCCKATTEPLVLSIEKDDNVLAEVKLYIKIDSVEKMFRHKNLLYTDTQGDHTVVARPDYNGESDGSGPKNWPDAQTNGKNLVFVHGYNVNPQQARGWAAEMFKRFWWAGSKAKFYAVTWPGAETQLNVVVTRVTPNYHANVMNGFGAAHALADQIDAISATGEVVTVAHSLGNLVATSAIHDWVPAVSKHIAIDAAMAIESLDAGAAKNMPNMAHPVWANYSQHAWCTEWYKLFVGRTPVDRRQGLTWRGRLGNALTKVWSFYSSGEEVLDNALDEEPGFDEVVVNGVGRYAWAMQEKLKGRLPSDYALGSRYGGWGMSDTSGWFPSVVNSTPGYVFMSNPFFDHGPAELAFLYDPNGTSTDYRVPDAFFTSNYNGYNANRLLAQMFPALTYAVGRNSVTAIDDYASGRQFDLNTAIFKPNGWPESRRNNDFPNWHHSDIREVAYLYIYPAFDKILTAGGLK